MALGTIQAARAVGRRIPADLSIVGFDNIEWAKLNDPPLTTLDVPKRQMGAEAARRLLALLKEPEDGALPTQLNIAVRLIERASTASPERG
jgi:DNA-binding LacI/PurR family transcriptional regulator